MKNTIEVKSCPFCGSIKLDYGHNYSCGDGYVKCDCGGLMVADTLEDAVAAWEKRTPTDASIAIQYPDYF